MLAPAPGLQGHFLHDIGIVVLDEAHPLRHKETKHVHELCGLRCASKTLTDCNACEQQPGRARNALSCAVPAAEDLVFARRLIAFGFS